MGDSQQLSKCTAFTSCPTEEVELIWTVERLKERIEIVQKSANRPKGDDNVPLAMCHFPINPVGSSPQGKGDKLLELEVAIAILRRTQYFEQPHTQHFGFTWKLADPKNCTLPRVWVNFAYTFLNKDGGVFKEGYSKTEDVRNPQILSVFSILDEKVMNEYFPGSDTSLTIKLKAIHFYDLQQNTVVTLPEGGIKCSSMKYLENPQCVMGDKNTADIILKVNKNKEVAFFCHRAVLSEVSPVFLKMIADNKKNKRESQIVVKNISVEAMSTFVHFLYCGSFKDLEGETSDKASGWITFIPELIVAAEQFDIPELKETCEFNLHRLFSKDNIKDMIQIVKTYKLKAAGIELLDYISRNSEFLLD